MEYHKTCIVCGKEFTAKRDTKKTCSNNCRARLAYRNKHGEVKVYSKHKKTPEQMRKYQRDYARNKYQNDPEYREKAKARRKETYYRNKRGD